MACLPALLQEHPKVSDDSTLAGAVASIQAMVVALWDAIEDLPGVDLQRTDARPVEPHSGARIN